MTSAHGQLITRNVSALYIHMPHCGAADMKSILTIGGSIASASAL